MALSTQELSLQQEEEEADETKERMHETRESTVEGGYMDLVGAVPKVEGDEQRTLKPSIVSEPETVCVIDLTDSPPESPLPPSNDLSSQITDTLPPVAVPSVKQVVAPSLPLTSELAADLSNSESKPTLSVSATQSVAVSSDQPPLKHKVAPSLPLTSELAANLSSSESKPTLSVSATQSVAVSSDQPPLKHKRGRSSKCLKRDSACKESEEVSKPKRRKNQKEEQAESLGQASIVAPRSEAGSTPLVSSYSVASLLASVPPASKPSRSSHPANESANSSNFTFRLPFIMMKSPVPIKAGAPTSLASAVPIFQIPTHTTAFPASFPSVQQSSGLNYSRYGASFPQALGPLVSSGTSSGNIGTSSPTLQFLQHLMPPYKQGTSHPSAPYNSPGVQPSCDLTSHQSTREQAQPAFNIPIKVATNASTPAPIQGIADMKRLRPDDEIAGQVSSGSVAEMAENVDKLEKLLHSERIPSSVQVAHQKSDISSQAPSPLPPMHVQEQTETGLDDSSLQTAASCSAECMNLESQQLVEETKNENDNEMIGEQKDLEKKTDVAEEGMEVRNDGEEEEIEKAEEPQDEMGEHSMEDNKEKETGRTEVAENMPDREMEHAEEEEEEEEEEEDGYCKDKQEDEADKKQKLEEKEERVLEEDEQTEEKEHKLEEAEEMEEEDSSKKKDEEERMEQGETERLQELTNLDQKGSVVEENEEEEEEEHLGSEHLQLSNREIITEDVATMEDIASPTIQQEEKFADEADIRCELNGDSDSVADSECTLEALDPGSSDSEHQPDFTSNMATTEVNECENHPIDQPMEITEEGVCDNEDPLPSVPSTPTQLTTAQTTSSPLIITPVSILKHISRYDSPTSTNKV